MLVRGGIYEQAGGAEECGLERVGDGEEEEDRDGGRGGEGGDERFGGGVLQVERGREFLELVVVLDILGDAVIVATWDVSLVS